MALLALEPGDRVAWTVRAADGRSFAVFALDGVDGGAAGYRVTDAACPHNQGELAQGWVRDGRILTCPSHWYRFDLDTGGCLTSPHYRLTTYPVVRRDGNWYADVGEKPAVRSWSERLRAHARGEV